MKNVLKWFFERLALPIYKSVVLHFKQTYYYPKLKNNKNLSFNLTWTPFYLRIFNIKHEQLFFDKSKDDKCKCKLGVYTV